MQYGQHLLWCIDVWENEPNINLEVLKNCQIATPHIAGHTLQSKLKGLELIYDAAVKLKFISPSKNTFTYPTQTLSFENQSVSWQEVFLKIFNPLILTQQLKENLLKGNNVFDKLRKEFKRMEVSATVIENIKLKSQDLTFLNNLGIKFLN